MLDKNCMSAGGSLSDRTAFKVYAPQRLHAATFRGVAAMINARPIWRTGPGVFAAERALGVRTPGVAATAAATATAAASGIATYSARRSAVASARAWSVKPRRPTALDPWPGPVLTSASSRRRRIRVVSSCISCAVRQPEAKKAVQHCSSGLLSLS